MLKYLSKFVLEIMPSIVATVVGAYIVANYINPKTPDAAKTAAVSTANPSDGKGPAATTPPEMKDGDGKAGAVNVPDADTAGKTPDQAKSPDSKISDNKNSEKTTDKPKEQDKTPDRAKEAKEADAKAKPGETVRPATAARFAVRTPAAPALSDEKKDANDLARAAIERLRGTAERGRSATDIQPAPVPQSQPVAAPAAPTTPVAPLAVATAPPLPPPVVVSTPNYGHRSADSGQDVPASGGETTGSADAARLVPPAEIPATPTPFAVRGSAVERPAVEQASIADQVMSTTKSFFRAITPN